MAKPITIIPASGMKAAFAQVVTQGKKQEAGVMSIPLACLALVQYGPGESEHEFAVVGYVAGEEIYCPENTEDFLGYLGEGEDGFGVYGDASKALMAEKQAGEAAVDKEANERVDK
jgi:hypothetical protein